MKSLKDVEWKSAIMKRLAASTELSDEAAEKLNEIMSQPLSPGREMLEMAKADLEKVMKENGSFITRNQATYDELELTQEQADALAALPVHDDIKNYKAVPLSDPKDIK